jgi:DNA-binding MarR family transcriptional regulator
MQREPDARQRDTSRMGVAWRELRRVAATGHLAYRFRNTSVGTLELAQVDALSILVDGEGRRMSELADLLRVDASTATRAVQRLVDAGMAERSPDPCDRRGVVVSATPAGHAVRDELVENARSAMGELLGGFDDGELRSLADLLDRFVAAIDAMAGDDPDD